MKISFRPRLVPTLCTIALAPVLIGLGLWQTDRAEQKSVALDRYLARINAPPLTVGASVEANTEIEYRQVHASGTWDQSREFFLDNRVLNRRAGFHVITPLLFKGSATGVLINRGWIEAAADRTIMPVTDPVQGSVELTGVAVIPPEYTFTLKDDGPLNDFSSPIWQALDLKRFSDAAPYTIQQFVIQLDPTHPDGFERQWNPPNDEWISRHKAYAFQWFALCATLLVIYFLLAFRPHKES